MLFTPYNIGQLEISNRFIRSATADSELNDGKGVKESTLERYRQLGQHEIGLIITGDFPVVDLSMIESGEYNYDHIRCQGIEEIPKVVKVDRSETKIIAQLSTENIYFIPSQYKSPWGMEGMHICSMDEIKFIEKCFIETAIKMNLEGFDGIQLHGAHGGFLSMFLSPYANHRQDDYGGNSENRCRIVTNIIRGIKSQLPDFPILIKINATEYFDLGMNNITLQETVSLLEEAGIDAIEYSGGLWEAMMLDENQLGFPVVPSLEAHTKI
jgi:2,4-dienoyl-CoA reductase-like NADH-dependent reductase (Old Yellow Enzyme family)